MRVGDCASGGEQGPRGQRRLDVFCLICESGSRLHVIVDYDLHTVNSSHTFMVERQRMADAYALNVSVVLLETRD